MWVSHCSESTIKKLSNKLSLESGGLISPYCMIASFFVALKICSAWAICSRANCSLVSKLLTWRANCSLASKLLTWRANCSLGEQIAQGICFRYFFFKKSFFTEHVARSPHITCWLSSENRGFLPSTQRNQHISEKKPQQHHGGDQRRLDPGETRDTDASSKLLRSGEIQKFLDDFKNGSFGNLEQHLLASTRVCKIFSLKIPAVPSSKRLLEKCGRSESSLLAFGWRWRRYLCCLP